MSANLELNAQQPVTSSTATAAPPSALDGVKAFVMRYGLMLFVAVVTMFPSVIYAQTEPPERPVLELDVNEMLFWMFEGANIIIVALGAVVFLTIGFVLGRKILELIRSAISSL